MAERDRRTDLKDFISKKTKEDPLITTEMATQLFNWNTDHADKEVTNFLLEEAKAKVLEKEGDVGRLVAKNKGTRRKELERILGKEFLARYSQDKYFVGFWRKYLVNFLKGDMTIPEIRIQNYVRNDGKLPPHAKKRAEELARRDEKIENRIKSIARGRYSQFDCLSEETKNEILKEIKEKLERGGRR